MSVQMILEYHRFVSGKNSFKSLINKWSRFLFDNYKMRFKSLSWVLERVLSIWLSVFVVEFLI